MWLIVQQFAFVDLSIRPCLKAPDLKRAFTLTGLISVADCLPIVHLAEIRGGQTSLYKSVVLTALVAHLVETTEL
jgi:hypothetical protein